MQRARFMAWWGRGVVWAFVFAVLAAVLVPARPAGFSRFVADGGALPEGVDFVHFFLAAEAAARGEDVYASYTGGYVYPPLLAAVLMPLVPMGIDDAAVVWYWGNAAAIFAAGVGAAWLIRRRVLGEQDPAVLDVGVLIAVGVGFELLKKQAAFAQTDGLVMIGLASLLPGVMKRRASVLDCVIAAVGMGLAVNIKFTAAAMLPYLLLTRRWGLAAGSALGVVGVALSTAGVFGWETNLRYLTIAGAGLLHVIGVETIDTGGFDPYPVAWINSVSVTSGLARVGRGAMLIGAPLVFLAWIGAAWWQYRRAGLSLVGRVWRGAAGVPEAVMARVGLTEWISVLCAVMVFSPQTTKRHVFPLLIGVVYAGMVAVSRVDGRTRAWMIGALAVLGCGLFLPPGSMEEAERAWQWVGGVGWCVLGFGVMQSAGLVERRIVG